MLPVPPTPTEWPLVKVISGGQRGVDLGALRAAKALGYQTGGTMPQGFLREDGCYPDMATEFGMVALRNGSYSERTRVNVIDAQATLVMGDLAGRGTGLTWHLTRVLKRRKLHIGPYPPEPGAVTDAAFHAALIRQWIIREQIKILNVAGNRESTHPGIEAWAEALLLEALKWP
jgi:hypothetical protein